MPAPSQSSLFDDESPTGTGVVEVLARRKPADKAEAAFHRLVAKLEQKRESLRAWQAYTIRFNQRLASELSPLQIEYRQVRRQLAFLLNELLLQPNGPRGKNQRAKLRRLIVDLAQDLLQDEADAELEALHDKYSECSHAENLDEDMAFSQAMIEDLMGVRLGKEHGANTLDELFARAERELHAKTEKAERKRAARQERRGGGKAEATQAKREQAAKEVSQTVRDIYRKLASALHPDRETDPAQRQRKTKQMQQVNQAYEAGDLLTLLSLQLEIEQIDATHLSSLPRQRLAHYNQVLREQLAELEAEIEAVAMPFGMAAQLPPFATLTPEQVDRRLSEDIAQLRLDIEQARSDLTDFRDPARLRQFLKDYRFEADWDEELIELAAMAEMFGAPQRSRRAKRRK